MENTTEQISLDAVHWSLREIYEKVGLGAVDELLDRILINKAFSREWVKDFVTKYKLARKNARIEGYCGSPYSRRTRAYLKTASGRMIFNIGLDTEDVYKSWEVLKAYETSKLTSQSA